MFISGGFSSCVVPFLLSFFSLLPKAKVLTSYSGTFKMIPWAPEAQSFQAHPVLPESLHLLILKSPYLSGWGQHLPS